MSVNTKRITEARGAVRPLVWTNPQVGPTGIPEAAAIIRCLRSKLSLNCSLLGWYFKTSKVPLRKIPKKDGPIIKKSLLSEMDYVFNNSTRQFLYFTNWSCMDTKWLLEKFGKHANNSSKECKLDCIIEETWLIKLFRS